MYVLYPWYAIGLFCFVISSATNLHELIITYVKMMLETHVLYLFSRPFDFKKKIDYQINPSKTERTLFT